MIADTDTGAVDSPCGPITTLVTVALALAVKLLSSVVSAVTIAPPSLVSAPSPAAPSSVIGRTDPSTAAEAKTPQSPRAWEEGEKCGFRFRVGFARLA